MFNGNKNLEKSIAHDKICWFTVFMTCLTLGSWVQLNQN